MSERIGRAGVSSHGEFNAEWVVRGTFSARVCRSIDFRTGSRISPRRVFAAANEEGRAGRGWSCYFRSCSVLLVLRSDRRRRRRYRRSAKAFARLIDPGEHTYTHTLGIINGKTLGHATPTAKEDTRSHPSREFPSDHEASRKHPKAETSARPSRDVLVSTGRKIVADRQDNARDILTDLARGFVPDAFAD